MDPEIMQSSLLVPLVPHEIHIWVVNLSITSEEEKQQATILSSDEIQRAKQFRFSVHKRRFIAARSRLRNTLAHYLKLAPDDLVFAYTEFKKPYLSNIYNSAIQFNLAHSHDIAVLAITLEHAIGVDIEKIQQNYSLAVAERYFSPSEYTSLCQLPQHDQTEAFFRLWTRKEAVIKAVGKGLSIPLSSFTVSSQNQPEVIEIENQSLTLQSLDIHPEYQSALASNQPIKEVKIFWIGYD